MPRQVAREIVPGYFLPLLSITLRVRGREFLVKAVVDSGADGSVLPAESLRRIMPFSSMPPGDSQEAAGPGGTFEIRHLDGSLTFARQTFRRDLAVAEPGALQIPVLGRDDFFRRFAVRFEWFRDPPVFDVDPITATN